VKKFSLIFFTLICLISSTELHQFLKLPLLIEHYLEHKSINQNLTVIDFLAIHYARNISNNADYKKDASLPFNSQDDCIKSDNDNILPLNYSSIICKPIVIEIKMFVNFQQNFLHSSFYSNIWQPPKFS